MRELGRKAKEGGTAKQNAIELFQKPIASEAGEYRHGRPLRAPTAKARQSLATHAPRSNRPCPLRQSQVIKVWPTLSATLTKLHDEQGQSLVSSETTGKDKFGQLYAAAKKYQAHLQRHGPRDHGGWVKTAVAKLEKSETIWPRPRTKAIADSAAHLLPAKPTQAQLKARDDVLQDVRHRTAEAKLTHKL